jgi:hypothetical protein
LKSRLSTVAPDLEDLLCTASAATRDEIALAVSQLALRLCDVVLPPDVALANGEEAYAAELDVKYFNLSEEGNAASHYAFSAARAVSSAAFARSGRCEDAIYEAIIATDDTESVRQQVVASLLAKSGRA